MTGRVRLFATGYIAVIAFATPAYADLWKCTSTDRPTPYFTETPSFGEEVQCEEVHASKFSKPGPGSADILKERVNRAAAASKGGSGKKKKNKKERVDRKLLSDARNAGGMGTPNSRKKKK